MSYSPLPTNPFGAPGQDGSQGVGPFAQGSFEIPRVRVAGNAPIFVHYSAAILVVLYGLIAFSSAGALDWIPRILITIVCPIFLLVSILIHELCHAYAWYKLYNVWVQGIYLYAMGGLTVAAPSGGEKKSMTFVVAVAGPLSNAVLGGILLGLYYMCVYWFLASTPAWLLFVLQFSAYSQFGLAIYNMLPGVPLDGSNAFVGILNLCMQDTRARLIAYSVGLAVLITVFVLTYIFLNLFAAIFLLLTFMYTCYALYDTYQVYNRETNHGNTQRR